MSGQKKLDRVTKHIRVAAIPSKNVDRELTDANGNAILDKNGEPQVEKVQLYKIKKLQ